VAKRLRVFYFMINILHIYCSNSFGGAEKAMLDIASAMQGSDFSNIVASPAKSSIANEASALGLKQVKLNIKGSLDIFGISKLVFLVFALKINILHAHQGKVFWPCIFVKWFSFGRIKVIFHRHTQGRHKILGRFLYSFPDKVIAVSKSVAQLLRSEHNVSNSKLDVVYGWVDESKFNPNVSCENIKEKLNISACKVIGTVGAINKPKGKGQEILIRAAAVLRNDFPNIRYLIVGDGDLRTELQELTSKLGLDKIVIFTGFKSNVEKYICAMDIFCLLSWDSEAFGRVTLEAQAMGKPVIATSIGGIPETVWGGNTGFIIAPLNVFELAEKLKLLLSDHSLYNNMAKAAPGFVSKTFNKENAIKQLGNIYKELKCK